MIQGRAYVVSISPVGLKLTLKGHRKGLELQWESLVSGEAALAASLNASIGEFVTEDRQNDHASRPAPNKTRKDRK